MPAAANAPIRVPLPARERLVTGLLGGQLVFVSWAFGGMVQWAQWGTLAFGAAAFAGATLLGGRDARVGAWRRLARFPLFWLGAALLGLLVVQAANPSWEWVSDGRFWWVRARPSAAWLPTSAATPFGFFNVWRQFIIYAAAWLSVCALWSATADRRSLLVLAALVVVNAALLAVVGFAQRTSGTHKVLWVREFPEAASFASFVYRNHAGTYLGMGVATALSLAVWDYYESRRRLARSSPAGVWLLASLALLLASALSLSRGAVITGVGFVVSAGCAFLVLRRVAPVPSTVPRAVTVALALGFLACAVFVVQTADLSGVQGRFADLVRWRGQEASYQSRALLRERALRMLGDHWPRGTGAGSFRFLFPPYIRDCPYLYDDGRAFWEHAHIDWLEIPIELGLAGVVLLIAGAGWAVWHWWRRRGPRHPVGLMLFLGLLQPLVQALFDFPFQNCAVLVTWWLLLTLMLRWLELDAAPAGPASGR